MEKVIAAAVAIPGNTRLAMSIRNRQNRVEILSDREYASLNITGTIEI